MGHEMRALPGRIFAHLMEMWSRASLGALTPNGFVTVCLHTMECSPNALQRGDTTSRPPKARGTPSVQISTGSVQI